MLFCEKCNYLTVESRCPSCGNKNLREVSDEDFCFFVNIDKYNFEILESALQEDNIDVVGVPYYSQWVTYANAGRADERKVYIRYKDIEKANEVFEIIFGIDD